jgi:hypothetical protein
VDGKRIKFYSLFSSPPLQFYHAINHFGEDENEIE